MSEHDESPGLMNLSFLERLYADYLHDPATLPPDWRAYFDHLADGEEFRKQPTFGPSFHPSSLFNPPIESRARGTIPSEEINAAALQERVDMLIRCYRVRGHMIARVDPLEQPQSQPPELDPASYKFTQADMERRFSCDTLHPDGSLPLREIIERLRNTYCRSI